MTAQTSPDFITPVYPIGAWSSAVLGYCDMAGRAYRKNDVISEQVELLALSGDLAVDNGRTVVHAHAIAAQPDGSTRGGHLLEAYPSPTTEAFVTTSTVTLNKQIDSASGLSLIMPTLEEPR